MTTTNAMVKYVPELEDIRRGVKALPSLKRFTDKKGRKRAMVSAVEGWKRLAAYEEIGLTPEIVKLLKELWFDAEWHT